MARTTPVFEMDAVSGKSAIYLVDPAAPNDRAPFLNPASYARYLLFHSASEFMRVSYDQSKTITFPDAGGKGSYSKEWPFPNHNLGKIPVALIAIGPAMLISAQPFQVAGRSKRSIELKITASGFTVVENVSKWYSDPLPAITRTVRVIALDILPAGSDASPFTFDMRTGAVRFGYGRFSNAGPPLIKAAKSGAGVQFRIPKPGPTLDTDNGGIKHVGPDGSTFSFGEYSGSFSGSGGWPVKI